MTRRWTEPVAIARGLGGAICGIWIGDCCFEKLLWLRGGFDAGFKIKLGRVALAWDPSAGLIPVT